MEIANPLYAHPDGRAEKQRWSADPLEFTLGFTTSPPQGEHAGHEEYSRASHRLPNPAYQFAHSDGGYEVPGGVGEDEEFGFHAGETGRGAGYDVATSEPRYVHLTNPDMTDGYLEPTPLSRGVRPSGENGGPDYAQPWSSGRESPDHYAEPAPPTRARTRGLPRPTPSDDDSDDASKQGAAKPGRPLRRSVTYTDPTSALSRPDYAMASTDESEAHNSLYALASDGQSESAYASLVRPQSAGLRAKEDESLS